MSDPDRESHPGMPRWVKVSGIIAIVLVLVIVIIVLVSGGEHGPRRHLPGGSPPRSPHAAARMSPWPAA